MCRSACPSMIVAGRKSPRMTCTASGNFQPPSCRMPCRLLLLVQERHGSGMWHLGSNDHLRRPMASAGVQVLRRSLCCPSTGTSLRRPCIRTGWSPAARCVRLDGMLPAFLASEPYPGSALRSSDKLDFCRNWPARRLWLERGLRMTDERERRLVEFGPQAFFLAAWVLIN